jgi:hypothetical protein
MKSILTVVLTLAGGYSAIAQEINSGVIHNYNFVGVSYDYVYGDNASDLHGGSGVVSYDLNNFLVAVGGGYQQGGGNPEIETWSGFGSIGYVLRLQENHINVIPSFGIGYSKSTATFQFPPFFSFKSTVESTAISPGLFGSYAFNNWFSVNAGYAYGYDVETSDDAHGFFGGAECALTEQVGVGISARFSEGQGFTGVSTGVHFHF